MILLKVIIYLLVFFPFLGNSYESSIYLGRISENPIEKDITQNTLKPLRNLAKAGFISDERVSDWRSLSINHISSQLREQCPTSYFGLKDTISEYNKSYNLEKENEAWMKEKIKAVIVGIKSCREEIRRAYVDFSHKVIVPLQSAYNRENSASKDDFQYLYADFVRYLQERSIDAGRFKVFGIKRDCG